MKWRAESVYIPHYHTGGPSDGLTEYNGKLYGVTSTASVNSKGVLFEFDPATSAYTKKADFSGSTTGAYLRGSLVQYGSKLCGITNSSDANLAGGFLNTIPP